LGELFVRSNPLHLTLREMQSLFRRPNALIGLGAVGLILGVSGPFQTFDQLLLVPRIIYWLAMTFVTFSVGAISGAFFLHLIEDWGQAKLLRPLVIGIASGIPVTLSVCIINWFVFEIFGAGDIGFLTLALYCILISAAVSMIYGLLTPKETAAPTPTRLMQRLPANVRGVLISLSVADHYVEVTTARGKAMILLRLSDAMAEVGPTEGMQIHRSHWVALDGIQNVRRVAGKVVVETKAGAELPVSRSYVPALKARGLLT
jgi:hypothetical protein